jgi:prepilin peptidase CpaA
VIFALAIWACVIAGFDWRQRRIPNVALLLLLVPALLALAVNGKGLLGVSAGASALGLLVGGGILLPGYVLGRMGAGDVKFAGCLGLLLGPWATVKMLLVFAIALGLVSLAMLLHARWRPGSGTRRIAAAPALVLGFIVQLGFPQWLPWNG